MSVAEKTRRIEIKTGEKKRLFQLPAHRVEDVIKLAEQLEVGHETLPVEMVLPEMNQPGAVLQGARHKEKMTQLELAKLTGIPQRHISEMENKKRPIGKANARKLAKALNVSYKIFL